MKQKILITGCTGHLGLATVKKFAEEGYPLVVLTRKISSALQSLKEQYGFPVVICDLTEENSTGEKYSKMNLKNLNEICSDRDCVIHLAGFVPKNSQEDRLPDVLQGNLFATINLASTLPKNCRFIFASTCEVYGKPRFSPITEEHPLHPLSYYGISKVAAEQALHVFCSKNDIPLTILRFTNIYGPGEVIQRAIPLFIQAAIQGEKLKIYGDGSDKRDFLCVTDAANYVLAALQKGKNRTYNLASGKSVTIKEIAEKILQISGSSMKIDFQERQKPAVNYVFDISRAQEDLGYVPQVELEEGLQKEIEWYREKKERKSE